MANNRMFLICNICEPEWKTMPPKAGFFLGKWYPGYNDSGYGNGSPYDGVKLMEFVNDHCHNNHEYPLRLEYECKNHG